MSEDGPERTVQGGASGGPTSAGAGSGGSGVAALGVVPAAPAQVSPVLARPRPRPQPRIELCPYCGQESVNTARCERCGGKYDALSKQATQNAMGPWWLWDAERPFRPGCSYETIRSLITRGSITPETVLRGPTTRQFWARARRTPGVAHLLGLCHSCQREVSPTAFMCQACGVSFVTETDRQHMGLSAVSLLPGQASAERIAAVSVPTARAPGVAQAGPMQREQAERPPAPGPTSADAFTQPMPESGQSAGGWNMAAEPTHDAGRHLPRHGHHHRRARPEVAVAFFLLGVILTVCGVGAALVTVQGGVEEALAAMGISAGGTTRLAAGGDLDGPEPTRDAPVGDDADVEGAGSDPSAVVASTPTSTGDPQEQVSGPDGGADQAPAEGSPAVAQAATPEQALAPLLARGQAADLEQAIGLVDRLEREGTMPGDRASEWRLALRARIDRAAMSAIP